MWDTIGALQFVISSDDYSSGQHTMVVTATTIHDETARYTFTFGKLSKLVTDMVSHGNSHFSESPENSAIAALVENREFVAAVTIAAVALAIFLLLTIAICLLIFYHRRVNKYRYGKCDMN